MAGVAPEIESEPEPSGEPEPEPEGEPYVPSNNSNTIIEKTEDDEPAAFAEPVPNWDEALSMYGWAWSFHIYFVGAAFALLALYSFVSLIRLRKKRLLSRGYFIALNAMLVILGVDRAVYMFVDAYNHKSFFPLSVAYLMLGLGFPCLTSAFSILFLALLQSTKTQLVPPKIQKPSFLTTIIIVHFLISIVSDVLLGFFAQTFALTLICQVSFIIWGLFLSVSFMIIFRRLYRSTTRLHRESIRLSLSKRSLSLTGNTLHPKVKIPKNSWGNAIKLTLAIAFLGSLTALLQLYGIVVVYGPVGGKIPEPWPWWSYQFIFRVVELAMCFIMSYVATQPFRYTKDGQEKDCTICCGVFMKKKKEEEDDSEYWAKYFEAAPPETFLPKTEINGSKGNSASVETQTTWKDSTNVNDVSVYDSNSLKKLLNKNKRYKLKGLSKTHSTTDLYHYDPEKVKVTSASFSSFGMLISPDSANVIHNNLESPQDHKNENMNANPQSAPTSPLLIADSPLDVKGKGEIVLSPVDLNAPLLRSETSL